MTARRIAAALLAAALTAGAVGVTSAPAQAFKDTTWPTGSVISPR
ncbi:hypothetical protein [Nocardioides sp. Soil777]|nr:hypothetical protein [Nocardioides sp. Soil777]